MKVRMFIAAALALALAFVAISCGGSDDSEENGAETAVESVETTETAESTEPIQVKVFFPFRETLFYRYYSVARDQGYFEDEGIEVEFQDGGGGTGAIQQVIAGNGQVAQAPASDVLVGMLRQPDLKAYYGIGNVNIFDIVVPADSDIQSVEDLDGKTVGITEFASGEVPYVRAALANAGLTFDGDVKIQAVTDSPPSILRAFEAGDIDAFSGSSFETTPLTVAGFEWRSIMPEELLQVPSNTLAAFEEMFESEEGRKALIGLARAFAKGEYFAETNPEAGLCISKKAVPEDHEDPEFARIFYDVTTEQTRADNPDAWGESNLAEWEALQEILLAEDSDGEAVLARPVDNLEDRVTNELIEEINDWDRAEVEADANSYEGTYPQC